MAFRPCLTAGVAFILLNLGEYSIKMSKYMTLESSDIFLYMKAVKSCDSLGELAISLRCKSLLKRVG